MLENKKNILEIVRQSIRSEEKAVGKLTDYVNDDFCKIVDKILHSQGRVIVTGIGKSANIGNKVVSTLNSTGTPAIFMHAADAIHGDLGIIQTHDIVICISKSGQTPEIKVLIPLIKNFGNLLIGMVGNTDSFLAQESDYIINCTVDREACPNNLAPTASTTAQLVMGDALAVALLECRGFTPKDFAKYHPGGSLGKQLYLRVRDISCQNETPSVKPDDSIKDVIIEISSKRLGVTAVLENDQLIGVITDGDLRRMLLKNLSIEKTLAKDIMSVQPKYVYEDDMAINALGVMRRNNITQALVVDANGKYSGVIHLHDLLKEGII
ncbi:MAG: KpsF/GutQ family sugar-phosphate isomerase [Bacteroidales bacterium]